MRVCCKEDARNRVNVPGKFQIVSGAADGFQLHWLSVMI